MQLNQRERKLVIGVGATVGLLGAYYLFIGPFIARGHRISTDLDRAQTDLREADTLETLQSSANRNWRKLQHSGELQSDAYQAGNRISYALQAWARASRVVVNDVQVDPPGAFASDSRANKPEANFRRVNIHVTALGNMAALSHFLWFVESAPLVLRVVDVQITSKKENTDDLQLQLSLSTLSPASGERPATADAGAAPAPRG